MQSVNEVRILETSQLPHLTYRTRAVCDPHPEMCIPRWKYHSTFPGDHDVSYPGLSVWKNVFVSKGRDRKLLLLIKASHSFCYFCFGGQLEFPVFYLIYLFSNPGEWRWGYLNYGGDPGCGDRWWTEQWLDWSGVVGKNHEQGNIAENGSLVLR